MQSVQHRLWKPLQRSRLPGFPWDFPWFSLPVRLIDYRVHSSTTASRCFEMLRDASRCFESRWSPATSSHRSHRALPVLCEFRHRWSSRKVETVSWSPGPCWQSCRMPLHLQLSTVNHLKSQHMLLCFRPAWSNVSLEDFLAFEPKLIAVFILPFLRESVKHVTAGKSKVHL